MIPMRINDQDMAHFVNRLKWETSAGLSVFRNLPPEMQADVAKMRLEAIQSVLNQIDRANEAVPVN